MRIRYIYIICCFMTNYFFTNVLHTQFLHKFPHVGEYIISIIVIDSRIKSRLYIFRYHFKRLVPKFKNIYPPKYLFFTTYIYVLLCYIFYFFFLCACYLIRNIYYFSFTNYVSKNLLYFIARYKLDFIINKGLTI